MLLAPDDAIQFSKLSYQIFKIAGSWGLEKVHDRLSRHALGEVLSSNRLFQPD